MEKKQNAERNNKGGRPPKSTTDKLKYRVTVKLATPDYYTLKSRARSAGISASEYLRECFRKLECRVQVARIEELLNHILL